MLEKISPRIRSRLQSLGRRAGFVVQVNGPRSRADLRLVHFLTANRVDLVLDVGANRGQFTHELFEAGFDGRVVSFEPLPNARVDLLTASAASGKDWQVAPPMALSDAAGNAEFLVTDDDTSSSLLQPTAGFVASMPQVRVSERISVRTETLNVAAAPYLTNATRPFLKIDVQGAERRVLRGAQEILGRFCGAAVEVCTDSLYADQGGLSEIVDMLSGAGFQIWDITTAYRNPTSLRIGAVDIVCFRPEVGAA